MTFGRPALITWVITAAFGLGLVGTWLRRGGISQHPPGSRLGLGLPPPYFPAPLVFTHLALAASGLIVWTAYLLSGRSLLAWLALGLLAPVDLLGFSMFGRWVGSRRLRSAAIHVPAPLNPGSLLPVLATRGPAESRLPVLLVAGHGIMAVTTNVLVLLTAIGFRTS